MPILFNTISDGETVYQRVLLLHGIINATNGSQATHVTVRAVNSTYLPLQYPVSDKIFKALVPLDPGLNKVSVTTDSGETTFIKVEYVPLLQNPPLRLCILVGKDSPMTFDVPEHRPQNGLQVAIERLRMQAYLWQAFTAEQMRRFGFGRRTFRFEEEFINDTITRDRTTKRSTIKVYVLRTDKTVKELRDIDLAQQRDGKNSPDNNKKKDDLFGITLKALENYGAPFNTDCYCVSLILDSHWDKQKNAILAHTALGGGAGFRRLGIFGSHLVHGWPGSLEELPATLLDQTPNDINRTANDCGEIEAEYKAFCIGSGAFLHEVGHSLTLTHTPSGLMSRGFNHFNRTFMPFERNPKFGNLNAITIDREDGAHWHPADVLRFRFHPCFSLPGDPIINRGNNVPGPTLTVVDSETLVIDSGSPLVFCEWFVGEELVQTQKNVNVDNPPKGPDGVDILPTTKMQLNFNQMFIKQLRSSARRDAKAPISLCCTAANQSTVEQKDLESFIKQSEIPGLGRKVPAVGNGLSGGPHYDFMVPFMIPSKQLIAITVYADGYVNGLLFTFEDKTSQLVGKNQGTATVVHCPYSQGAYISQVAIRGGHWIDGLEISLDGPRGPWKSAWIGGNGGGEPKILRPYEGRQNSRIVGFYGTQGDFTDSLGVIISG